MLKRFAWFAVPVLSAFFLIGGCDGGSGASSGIPKDAATATPPPMPEMKTAKEIAKQGNAAPLMPGMPAPAKK